MVHWLWLIVSAVFGSIVGIFFTCIVMAGAEATKRMEADRG